MFPYNKKEKYAVLSNSPYQVQTGNILSLKNIDINVISARCQRNEQGSVVNSNAAKFRFQIKKRE